ncbi:MAG: Lrp/AsnC ligand binding domain-containing protein [Candidatus Aureabacteria bacterium]|nr:Lrp/AsnC ligand binding domain-containing protein [Candidatus Auribacterota bacterium]
MVTVITVLKVERKKVNDIANQLSDVDGVTEVYSVSGRFDLVAIIRTKDNDKMSDIVTNHMLKIDGILDSETMIAFRSFSKHNLESMFSIGIEE